ncbi:PAS domain-containing sensor histidine kinase [Sphingobium mellinum]|uniref:PAS domain-containing sensor histidine kinase n=1 Tax=Sphingobium mellinum TaxID=1387166 RepID=UPI0030EDBF7C
MTWPSGNGEMAARVREHDWAATPLGPISGWPDSLRYALDLLLDHPMPMTLLWGDALVEIYNDQYAKLVGQQHPTRFGRPHRASWAATEPLNPTLIARIRAGESVLIDDVSHCHPATGRMEVHWYTIANSPVRGPNGLVDGILLTVLETTERKAAEQRIRQEEERHLFLLRLNDALRPLADPAEVQRTAMRMVNDRLKAVRSYYIELGGDGDTIISAQGVDVAPYRSPFSAHPRLRDFGEWILESLAQDRPVIIEDCEEDPRIDLLARDAFRRAGTRAAIGFPQRKHGKLAGVISVDFQTPRRWSDEELNLMAAVAHRIWDAVERARAETALRRSEEQLRLMVAELQHRVRNILTVVRSVFTRSMESGRELDDMVDHFRGRLDALARAQVIVTQTAAGTADLQNLVRDELISVGVCDGPNVSIDGPDILLDSCVAETLGLAVHELTTNALKYGALKGEGGRLEIGWSVRTDPGGRDRLDLHWNESGVPAVALTGLREGFGRELIEQALPYRLGATTRLEFRGGGVRCLISVPLDTDTDRSATLAAGHDVAIPLKIPSV